MSMVLALIAAAVAPAAAAEVAADPQRSDEIVVTAQRTEGSGDYTTTVQSTAVRLPLSKRETPQSMSIVTNAQMRDFKLNDVNQLLATVPGVNVLAVETDRVYYSARGFDIQTFQIDGVGLPFAFQIQTGSIDTSIYDHIEVIRGAPGLLSSTGNPSAVINFIRKRPTKDLEATFSAQYGSYNNLRLDGDVSAPLTANGALRARVVGAFVDTDSYLDRYHLRRWTGYGIVEGDLGPEHDGERRLWPSGPSEQWRDVGLDPALLYRRLAHRPAPLRQHRARLGGLERDRPADLRGRVAPVRRRLDRQGERRCAARSPRRTSCSTSTSNPDKATGLGVITYPGAFDGPTRNLTLDAYVGGPVSLFGRMHDRDARRQPQRAGL
jgi:outer membrane receptor for ferric coprogen and ferric-rhodotorulic acid